MELEKITADLTFELGSSLTVIEVEVMVSGLTARAISCFWNGGREFMLTDRL